MNFYFVSSLKYFYNLFLLCAYDLNRIKASLSNFKL